MRGDLVPRGGRLRRPFARGDVAGSPSPKATAAGRGAGASHTDGYVQAKFIMEGDDGCVDHLLSTCPPSPWPQPSRGGRHQTCKRSPRRGPPDRQIEEMRATKAPQSGGELSELERGAHDNRREPAPMLTDVNTWL